MTNEQNLNQEQKIQNMQTDQLEVPKSSGKNWSEVAARATESEEKSSLLNDIPMELLEHPSATVLQESINKLEQDLENYKQKALLAAADLENSRRRFERDISNAHKYSIGKLLEDLIPVVDSLERGLEVQVDGAGNKELLQQMHSGMELTLDILIKTLDKYGVKQLNPVGEAFNPVYHEAMAVQPDTSVPENTVLRVVQKGYLLKDRVIRPAMVLVSK